MSDMENMNAASTHSTSTAWIRGRLTALYGPGDASDAPRVVGDAFDRTFARACEVRVNHEVQALQALRDELTSRYAAAATVAARTQTHVSVAWDADVVSTNEDKPEEPAVVAGALVVTRTLPFRIRAGPAQRQTHVHFSAKIEQDASVHDGDRRRITSFYYTSVDRTPPIHFAVPRAAQEGVDSQ